MKYIVQTQTIRVTKVLVEADSEDAAIKKVSYAGDDWEQPREQTTTTTTVVEAKPVSSLVQAQAVPEVK